MIGNHATGKKQVGGAQSGVKYSNVNAVVASLWAEGSKHYSGQMPVTAPKARSFGASG